MNGTINRTNQMTGDCASPRKGCPAEYDLYTVDRKSEYSGEVFSKDAEDERYERHKKIAYRNLILKSLLAFLFGLLCGHLFRELTLSQFISFLLAMFCQSLFAIF